jgi:hypothetical protein
MPKLKKISNPQAKPIVASLMIGGATVASFADFAARKAQDAEFDAPAPYIVQSPRRVNSSPLGDGARGKAGSGKRAMIKSAMLSAMLDFNAATVAAEFNSTLSSVRSIKSDLLATLSACHDDLSADWQAIISKPRDNWLACFNRFLADNPGAWIDDANDWLADQGFLHVANGADFSASRESLKLMHDHGCFDAQLKLLIA